ncbi:tyrosine-type recombinase/integrase [Faecalibacterium intestinale]|uniref:Site-specific integrase n=1 Tax=Faecalibacterium intestinale TaxID=3133155 RepID=A0ABV1C260_9FIRM
MGKRTNTATWNGKQWRIAVQKDGQRRYFYSSTQGRAGQREANAKADAWLDSGVCAKGARVADIGALWLRSVELSTSTDNYRPLESRWRVWVLPVIGAKKVDRLTDQDLQDVLNLAHAAGKSRKTLKSIAADMRAFCKYCRKSKISAYEPEELTIPAGARYKGKNVLQPDELAVLFNSDTTTFNRQRVPDPYINAYRFQVLTGLRPGELLGLRWEDVHGGVVYICRSINQLGEETQGKNQNAVRSFALSARAWAVLEDQHKITGNTGSVFRINNQHHYHTRWWAYCRTNGIVTISTYELRHTFVSVAKTLPAGEVKGLVGHSQDMDTFGVYGHALTGDAENIAQAVNAAFDKLLGEG